MTTITNPDRFEIQSLFLKQHLKLQMLGMKHSKLNKTQLLQKCSAITGKKYSNRNLQPAYDDMCAIVEWAKGGQANVA
jgi:hypothetical protein